MKRRYERNIGTITVEENEKLHQCSACVIGCGGLGGHIIEGLARIGIGKLTVVDGDCFDETNLNRQLLSREKNLGQPKAVTAKQHVAEINSQVEVIDKEMLLTAENGRELIRGHQVVIDALDNIQGRKALEECCREENIPLVHGAIGGWHGQVTVIYPEDRVFRLLYPTEENKVAEIETGNPSFTPAVVGALQVAEAVKVLLGREGVLRHKLLTVDLLNHEYEVVDI